MKVTRPVVCKLGYEGLVRVEDQQGEIEDDWVKPERYTVGPPDPVTELKVSLEFCMRGQPIKYFRAKRREGDWEFIDPINRPARRW